MTTEVKFTVGEPDFGASTSLEVTFADGIVISAQDTSTGETNYVWDRWNFEVSSLVGRTIQEAENLIFAQVEGDFGYRAPFLDITIKS